MGNSDALVLAIEKFWFACADQDEKDYASFIKAIKSATIAAEFDYQDHFEWY